MVNRGVVAVVVAAGLWLAIPGLAQAASTRYASPTGTPSATCPQSSPCDLVTAIDDAASGDTVIVESGTYGSAGSPLSNPLTDHGDDITIEGQAIGPDRPVIYDSGATTGDGLELSGAGSEVRDIELLTGGAINGLDLAGPNETVDRVITINTNTSGENACVIDEGASNAVVDDSLCVATDPNAGSGLAVQVEAGGTANNDTFVGDYGLFNGGTLTGTNLILHGTGSHDLLIDTPLTLNDCEWSTDLGEAPSGSGQVSAAPEFVDAAADNFHTEADSPGNGKGANSSTNGTYDLDGDLREINGKTDIGAYEHTVAPTVSTGAASAVAETRATVGGSFNQGGAPGAYKFVYGTSSAYGSTAGSVTLPGSTTPQSVTAALTGLAPDTTYDYQLVLTVDGTTYDGGNGTFKTAAPPPPANTALPVISGTGKAGDTVTCSTGTWSNSPSKYTYQWELDGTPIQRATSSTYKVAANDEGSTLTCTVTATGLGGTGSPATSHGLLVAVPKVKGCPPASGSVSGTKIGALRLGMTRAQARHAYAHVSTRGTKYQDFFCLEPHGIRDGYGSPKLLREVSKKLRAKLAGRVVWLSTDAPRYAVRGIRAGATLTAAKQALAHGYYFRVGANHWYLARDGAATAVLKVRGGIVEEIGIADEAITGSHKADRELMTSFD